jgi:rfaE bifunctional protein nucleotidyltransferase chain/domain
MPCVSKPVLNGRVLTREAMAAEARALRAEGCTLVATGGCFDLVHVGHIRSLQAARALGDRLLVMLNSDSSVRALKGANRPVIHQAARAELLAALRCVDYVVIFDETTPAPTLATVQPAVFCKGAEYAPPDGKPLPAAEADAVASYNGRVAYLPMIPDNSTTLLIERILARATNE